jgi:hypothetical protein
MKHDPPQRVFVEQFMPCTWSSSRCEKQVKRNLALAAALASATGKGVLWVYFWRPEGGLHGLAVLLDEPEAEEPPGRPSQPEPALSRRQFMDSFAV